MSKEFELIDRRYKENEGIPFNIIVLLLMENGYDNMRNMTDEDIMI